MKDQILCAIDFSESSAPALQWAGKLAKASGANLAVLYSYRLLQTGKLNDIVSFRRKTEEDSRKKFVQMEKAVLNGEVPSTFITEIGFYSDNIENFIRKNPMTLVVLSEVMANLIYDHKGQSLIHFLKALRVPLLIVPNIFEERGVGQAESEIPKGKIAI
jgi:nucleotide-binding universal stress UspA family protein